MFPPQMFLLRTSRSGPTRLGFGSSGSLFFGLCTGLLVGLTWWVVILSEQWAGERLLFFATGGLGAQFLCRLFHLVQVLIFGAHVGSLGPCVVLFLVCREVCRGFCLVQLVRTLVGFGILGGRSVVMASLLGRGRLLLCLFWMSCCVFFGTLLGLAVLCSVVLCLFTTAVPSLATCFQPGGCQFVDALLLWFLRGEIARVEPGGVRGSGSGRFFWPQEKSPTKPKKPEHLVFRSFLDSKLRSGVLGECGFLGNDDHTGAKRRRRHQGDEVPQSRFPGVGSVEFIGKVRAHAFRNAYFIWQGAVVCGQERCGYTRVSPPCDSNRLRQVCDHFV